MSGNPLLKDPEWLGQELARAYRHIEWLCERGMGNNSNSFGIRLNAREFVQRPVVTEVLMRWPYPYPPKE